MWIKVYVCYFFHFYARVLNLKKKQVAERLATEWYDKRISRVCMWKATWMNIERIKVNSIATCRFLTTNIYHVFLWTHRSWAKCCRLLNPGIATCYLLVSERTKRSLSTVPKLSLKMYQKYCRISFAINIWSLRLHSNNLDKTSELFITSGN